VSADLKALLGTPLDGPAVAAFLEDARIPLPLPGPSLGGVYLPDHGLNIHLDRDKGTVTGVTVILDTYAGVVPYDLSASSDRAAVEAALGAPAYVSNHVGRDGVGLQYFREDVTVWVNVVEGCMRDLAVREAGFHDKLIWKRLSNPAGYGAPPRAASAAAVRAMSTAWLAEEWRPRDTLARFQDTYMPQIEAGVARFIQAASEACADEDMAALLQSVKDLVDVVNAVNLSSEAELDEPMVETLERDELGAFIDAVCNATGAQFEDGDDVTLPWREW